MSNRRNGQLVRRRTQERHGRAMHRAIRKHRCRILWPYWTHLGMASVDPHRSISPREAVKWARERGTMELGRIAADLPRSRWVIIDDPTAPTTPEQEAATRSWFNVVLPNWRAPILDGYTRILGWDMAAPDNRP